ncbi:MAG: hypothetical protein Q9195_001125 [Heterodermia aff. obscurata]
MKTVIHLICLAATLTVASAAAAAAAPRGFVITYTGPNCVNLSLPDGSVTNSISTPITQNKCYKLNMFVSFQGGVGVPCPKGQTPQVLAYGSDDCSGAAVTAGTLPANSDPSACQEIVSGDIGSGVNLGGHSAEFICVAA